MASKKTFEGSVSRLSEIVELLEKGELPLEESIKLFEEGTKLVAACNRMLDDAEQKVTILRKDAEGQTCEVPFEVDV